MPNVDRRGGNPSHQIEDILVGYQKRAQNNLFLIIKKLGKDLKKIIFEHFLPKKSLKNDIFKDNSKCGMCGIKREPKTISSWLLWNFERILTKKIIFRICLPKNKSKIDIFKQNSKCGTCGISKESPKHYVFFIIMKLWKDFEKNHIHQKSNTNVRKITILLHKITGIRTCILLYASCIAREAIYLFISWPFPWLCHGSSRRWWSRFTAVTGEVIIT